MAELVRRIGRLWPSVCVVCHRAGERDLDLCTACRTCLPGLVGGDGRLCPHCGEWLPDRTGTAVCTRCAARRSPFSRLVVPWRFAFPLDRLIRRMKYHDERVLARVLGTALAREARRPVDGLADAGAPGGEPAQSVDGRAAAIRASGIAPPDVLMAVPSRIERRESGFDHAAALTRWCAREARLPDASGLATRVVDTGSLAGLSRAERAIRIRGAFRVDERVAGLGVAIVDDVLTSGATAGELARELYDTGAGAVELWVLARTPAER